MSVDQSLLERIAQGIARPASPGVKASILTSAGEKMPNIELGPRVVGMLGDMGWQVH